RLAIAVVYVLAASDVGLDLRQVGTSCPLGCEALAAPLAAGAGPARAVGAVLYLLCVTHGSPERRGGRDPVGAARDEATPTGRRAVARGARESTHILLAATAVINGVLHHRPWPNGAGRWR